MSDKKHTPKPWRWSPLDDDGPLIGRNGKIVLQPGYTSCNVDIFGTIKASAADKKLIAAAPDMLDELMNYCAECNGDGAERCPYYSKDGDMCRMAQDGTCGTWMTICLATGHDPATPWEVTK